MTNNRNATVAPFGLLKALCSSQYVHELASGKNTHEPALRLVAQLASHTQDEELVHRIIASALPPDYRGNTLTEVPGMLRDAIKKGFHERPRESGVPAPEPASLPKILLNIIEQAGEMFHDEHSRGFLRISNEGGAAEILLLRSNATKTKLRYMLYCYNGKLISDQQLQNCIDTLSAIAVHDRPRASLHVRIARVGNIVYYDLYGGEVVQISAEGWAVTQDCPVNFYRPAGLSKVPTPVKTLGALEALRKLLGLSNRSWLQILAFLLVSLRPGDSYMILLIEGEQGSGKSLLASIVKMLIDPSAALKLRLPETVRDLMIHTSEIYLLNFDNSSGMKNDISDALCSLLTKGGFATRKLYADEELVVFDATRPVIINGIADFVQRPDLMDRAIPIELPSMKDGARKSEGELLSEFQRIRPAVMGALFDCIACALKNEATVKTPEGFRMADCAAWIAAAEPATGVAPGEILKAMKASQDELMIDRVTNDPIVIAIEKLLTGGPIDGRISDVFAALPLAEFSQNRFTPSTPQHFSRHLARLAPAMRKAHIFVEFGARTREGRTVRIWRPGQEKARPVKLTPGEIFARGKY